MKWGLARLALLLGVVAAGGQLFGASPAQAYANTPPIDPAYNSRIIDDSIFLNTHTMSVQDIQNFLNAKVPTCDTNHQGGLAQYPPPYTCLKDYVDPTTGKRAAQLIYDEANDVGLNPQVILVTLEKEQGLVTDTWPYPSQYRSAMGYGCPESQSVCDSVYYGFYNQVHLGARLLRAGEARDCGDTSTLSTWSISTRWMRGNTTTIDGRSTYLSTCATGSLYNYTPHRPDSAYTLAADGNYYYGNYNFVNYFTSWFGPTFGAKVIQAPGDTRLFLLDGNVKHWIPTGEINRAWGLESLTAVPVTQSYFDSVPTGSELTRAAKAPSGAVYYLDNGHKHWVQTDAMLATWNISAGQIVSLSAALDLVPEAEWAGRLVKSLDGTTTWMISGNTKYKLLTGDDQYHWGLTPTNFTYLSAEGLADFTTGADLGTHISFNGHTYVVDRSTLVLIPDQSTATSWGISSFTAVNPAGPSMLGAAPTAGVFVKDMSAPAWYMLSAGAKRYIPSGDLAAAWGLDPSGRGVLTLSSSLMAKFGTASDVSRFVIDGSSGKYYLIDGRKYYLPDAATASAWLPSGASLPTYDTNSLARLGETNASLVVRPSDSGNIYTLDHGQKLYILNGNLMSAWGVPRLSSVQVASAALVRDLPEGTAVKQFVSNGGTTYFLDDGYRRPVPSNLAASWGATSPVAISSEALARFTAAPAVGPIASLNGQYYALVGGRKQALGPYTDAYGTASATPLSRDMFADTGSPTTDILQSNNPADPRMWLVSNGSKYYFDNTPRLASYGFLSQGVKVTYLDQPLVDSLTTQPALAPLCIKSASSGVKFLNFGTALGFPDGATLTNLCPTVTTVSDSVFNAFGLKDYVSRVVKDDSGRLYFIENGTKRWISSGATYEASYRSYPITYLYGTTMALIPDGAPLP